MYLMANHFISILMAKARILLAQKALKGPLEAG
jgi:hypothetical protein